MKYKHDWEKNPEVIQFLEKIYHNTIKELSNNKYPQEGETTERVVELVSYVEDFLYLIKTNGYDLERVMTLLDKLCYITIKDIDTPVLTFDTKIVLSSLLYQNDDLSDETKKRHQEQRRYYLNYGLAKKIFQFKNEVTENFCTLYSEFLNQYRHQTQVLIHNSWLLFEEVFSEELAEIFTYASLEKNRLVSGVNFDNYILVYSFGLTLNKVGSIEEYGSQIVMLDLLKKAINSNFSKEVIKEYLSKGNQFELYQILYFIGILFNEQNQRFPHIYISEEEKKQVSKSLDSILSSLITLEQDDYQDIDSIPKANLNQFQKARLLKMVENKTL